MKSSGTIYWYGMNSDALIETDLANNDLSAYIFMNGKRVGRQLPTNEVDFYFTDALGTSRYVYSLAGANVSDYYPFGGERPISTGTPNHYKFTGKERDSESGLDNFGARYDSSQYGRFMTADPGNAGADASNPQSWNMYSYVLNNPINLIDPEGLCSRSDGSFGSGNDPNSGNSGEVSACDIEQDQSLASDPQAKAEPSGRCGLLCNLVGWLGSGAGSGDAMQEVMNGWNWNMLFGGGGGASSSQTNSSNPQQLRLVVNRDCQDYAGRHINYNLIDLGKRNQDQSPDGRFTVTEHVTEQNGAFVRTSSDYPNQFKDAQGPLLPGSVTDHLQTFTVARGQGNTNGPQVPVRIGTHDYGTLGLWKSGSRNLINGRTAPEQMNACGM